MGGASVTVLPAKGTAEELVGGGKAGIWRFEEIAVATPPPTRAPMAKTAPCTIDELGMLTGRWAWKHKLRVE